MKGEIAVRPRHQVYEPVARPVPIEDALRQAIRERGLELVNFRRGPTKRGGTILLRVAATGGFWTVEASADLASAADVALDDRLYDAMVKEVDKRRAKWEGMP